MKRNILFEAVLFCTVCSFLGGCRRGGDEPAEMPVVAGPAEQTVPAVDEKEPGKITAVFRTSMGDITCVLYPEKAPATVKNFVSLARGTKEWFDPKTEKEVSRPLYNDTVFHRVIPDFMIQGGDPLGNGMGGPGYEFKDEISKDLKFDAPGILAMANAGPDTNGSQFFITVAPTPWLNGLHTIFGRVISGQDVVEAISKAERDRQDMPLKAVLLKRVEIIEK
ncbi:MAG: peptidylprolyl isomerase [Candidatus Omnitrophica bacterium]|nr:peptidylprolyl isomerase [Candidatus Omnitrophota bacterium]